ncbi:MAG: helix-turn-helix domain-containing protein [Methylovirgula sp.]|nr:helix-turn-helix domain-containing protein [Methylovirgula sp.]
MKTPVPIGALARESRVKVPTIRYYEQIGLLPTPPRSGSNRRLYTAADVARLGFIRHARELGFGLDAIRALLALQERPEQSCDVVDSIARARLAEVEDKIARLSALKAELQRMLASCVRGKISGCQVIEALAGYARSP